VLVRCGCSCLMSARMVIVLLWVRGATSLEVKVAMVTYLSFGGGEGSGQDCAAPQHVTELTNWATIISTCRINPPYCWAWPERAGAAQRQNSSSDTRQVIEQDHNSAKLTIWGSQRDPHQR